MKQIISKHKKRTDGKLMQMVVYKESIGKVNGKERFKSTTKHEPQ